MITPLNASLVSLLLQGIQNEREGYSVSSTNLRAVIDSFVCVEKYKKKAPLDLYDQVGSTS